MDLFLFTRTLFRSFDLAFISLEIIYFRVFANTRVCFIIQRRDQGLRVIHACGDHGKEQFIINQWRSPRCAKSTLSAALLEFPAERLGKPGGTNF